jgi:hypothetical protein
LNYGSSAEVKGSEIKEVTNFGYAAAIMYVGSTCTYVFTMYGKLFWNGKYK